MVDVQRAYRRWLLRRIALLLPSSASSLAVFLWILLEARSPSWIKVLGAALSLLLFLLGAWFLVQTLHCSRLHSRKERAAARLWRSQSVGYREAGAVMMALLVMVVVVEGVFPPPRPLALPPIVRSRPAVVPTRPPIAELPLEILEPPRSLALPLPAAPEPVKAGEPEIKPATMDLPLSLAWDDHDFFDPPPRPEPARIPEVPALARDEPLPPLFRPGLEDLLTLDAQVRPGPRLERRGLGEGHDEDTVPPEIRLDALLLVPRDGVRGGGVAMELDFPVDRDDSFRTTLLGAVFGISEGEDTEERPVWQRMTLEYVRRLAGFNRRAGFDLEVAIGLSVDRYAAGEQSEISGIPRPAPYVAVDAGIWEAGMAGLLLHAGYSIPVDVTGGSSSVVDVSLQLRIDLSERVSFHAGYRILWVRFSDYDGGFGEDPVARLQDRFGGPLAGLDIRF